MFTVITESIGWSRSQPIVCHKTFSSREAALDWIAEEIAAEDVLRVRCPELDLEEAGEYC